MNYSVPLLLIIASLAILLIGTYTWRLTSQRTVMANTLFGSFALLYAAYEAVARNRPEWSFVLPFFVTMLFGGRALGAWWRSRKEIVYRRPAELLTSVACVTLLVTLAAYRGA